MRILSLGLQNYRCFPELEEPVTFDPSMTVIAATNGRGKSSILDAITIALSPFANRFEHGDRKSFRVSDAFLKPVKGGGVGLSSELKFPVSVHARFLIDEREVQVARELKTSRGRTTVKDASELRNYADFLSGRIKSDEEAAETVLPVVSYYGTGRLHSQKRLTQKWKPSQLHNQLSRTMGYLDCLSSESSYKHFAEWMKDTTMAQLQEADESYAEGSPAIYKGMLDAVSGAVQCVLEGQQWSDLRHTVRLKQLTVLERGIRMPLSYLSDGLRSVIAMVGDLAYRCLALNPHLGAEAPRMTPGIVLIDEIEMHLHPAWQQRILRQLANAFPRVQFICTTHSPQVLSTVRQESIRLITRDSEILSGSEAGANSYGAQSHLVMEELMEVSPNPRVPEVEQLKEKLKHRVQRADLTLDDPELEELEHMIGARDPFLRNLKATIIRKRKGHA